jgi:organic radical activating enzyme|tara:strand:- start:278 stop:1600 length:1323 start_codon:yes stop_codon:yes gene_type:complete
MPNSKSNKPAVDKKQAAFLKDLLLKRSDTFCMIPWVHMHTTPTGQGAPCCISNSCADNRGVGNSNRNSLADLVNSPKMKKLRLDMIKGTKNPECGNCHKHDDQGVPSFRTQSNKTWEKHFDDVIETTDMNTGRIINFRMRYFDIRFSNICNFKCRTCGSAFSSKWEQEDLESREQSGLPMYAMELEQGNSEEFLLQVLKQVPNFEIAYFAGGEPLITEEHYRLIDEMIKTGNTDIQLRYNSNISNFKYKKRDLFTLWQHFSKPIEIYASIDHMGEKAEYIRHGTKWKTIETNLKRLKKQRNVIFQVNTVYSIFNALTISHFYKYMIDNHFYTPNSPVWTLYNMGSPEHLSVHVLPEAYKEQALEQLQLTIKYMSDLGFNKSQIDQIELCIPWLTSKNTWDDQQKEFKEEIKRIDTLRGENFQDTFPELASLYKAPKSLLP